MTVVVLDPGGIVLVYPAVSSGKVYVAAFSHLVDSGLTGVCKRRGAAQNITRISSIIYSQDIYGISTITILELR